MGKRKVSALLALWATTLAACVGGTDLAGTSSTAVTTDTSGSTAQGAQSASPTVAFDAASPIRLQQPGADGNALCLEALVPSDANDASLRLSPCSSSAKQAFVFDGNLVRASAGGCIGTSTGASADAAPVGIVACDDPNGATAWRFQSGHLQQINADKCIAVAGAALASGATLELVTCEPSASAQLFGLDANATATATADGTTTPSTSTGTSTSTSTSTSTATSTDTNAVSLHTVTGTSLKLSQWQQEVWAAGTFNHEQQSYTNGGANVSFASDGTATIVAKPTGSGWTSARLSGDVMGPLPWYLEADLVAPTGQGSWPAFWLTARTSWPQGGEIDVMETVNGLDQTNISTHWGPTTGNATFNTHEIVYNVNGGQRHRYGVWVSAQGLQFYLDGVPVGSWVTFPAESNFTQIASQMVPIVNIAMGGDWPGNAPQSTGQQKMVVYKVIRAASPPSQ